MPYHQKKPKGIGKRDKTSIRARYDCLLDVKPAGSEDDGESKPETSIG